jgi:hypothetical protein
MNYLDRLREFNKDKKAKKVSIFLTDKEALGAKEAKEVTDTEIGLTAVESAPTAPLQPGWLVVYRDGHGTLCGGFDDRERGTVQDCRWDGTGWTVLLTNGDVLQLTKITAVAKTDAAGTVVAGWLVKSHGYDGRGDGQA